MKVAELKPLRLGANDRDGRSKISDAIKVLRSKAGFGEHDKAIVCVGLLRLPSPCRKSNPNIAMV